MAPKTLLHILSAAARTLCLLLVVPSISLFIIYVNSINKPSTLKCTYYHHDLSMRFYGFHYFFSF